MRKVISAPLEAIERGFSEIFGTNCCTAPARGLLVMGESRLPDPPCTQNLGVEVISAKAAQGFEDQFQRWMAQDPAVRPPSFEEEPFADEMHTACHVGNERAVRAVLNGPDGYVRSATPDRYGRTPLHIAAYGGHFEIVKMLIDCWGTKRDKTKLVRRRTKDGYNATELAATRNLENILELLMVHHYAEDTTIIGDLERKYGFKRGVGFILRVYEALKVETRIKEDFGLTQAEIQDQCRTLGYSTKSVTGAEQLLRYLEMKRQPAKMGRTRKLLAGGYDLRSAGPVRMSSAGCLQQKKRAEGIARRSTSLT